LTVATTLRLEAVKRTAFDCGLARLGGGKLTRATFDTYLETDRVVEDVTHQLALAGVRVTRCAGVPALGSGLRPAIGFDLVPLGEGLQAIDIVEVLPLSLSAASAALMRSRLPWSGGSRHSREACRRLLRGEDAVLGWRRVVWCSVASLRVARTRVRLRPVVFDRAAVPGGSFQWTYVNDGAIERWAFA
jgi:hypothetical protein